MKMGKFHIIFLALFTMASQAAWACDAAGPNTHVGAILNVNAAEKTFTIRDAETQVPITFVANNEIIDGLKGATGNIMVNFEETDSSKLKAIGVTF